MRAPIKTLLFLLALAAQSGAPVLAATFKPGPGISTDTWVEWPDESKWGDRDVILPFPEWRKHLDETDIAALKSAGFEMVRLTVDPAVFLSGKTTDLRDELMQSVLDSLRMITAQGLKVILDLHAIPGGANRSVGTNQILAQPELFDAYVELVRAMARLIRKEDPASVALELMNEPTADCLDPANAADWAAKLKRLYAAARASALDTTLVLSGACWGGAEGLVALDPADFNDDNLLWSFHSYAPFIVTHQGAGWTGDISPLATGIPYPPNGQNADETSQALKDIHERVNANASFLRRSSINAFVESELAKIATQKGLESVMGEPFDQVSAWAKKHDIDPSRILLGEFGMIRQEYGHDFATRPKWRAAYYTDMIALADKHGFAWSLWSYSGAFGVVGAFGGEPAEGNVLDVVRKAAR